MNPDQSQDDERSISQFERRLFFTDEQMLVVRVDSLGNHDGRFGTPGPANLVIEHRPD